MCLDLPCTLPCCRSKLIFVRTVRNMKSMSFDTLVQRQTGLPRVSLVFQIWDSWSRSVWSLFPTEFFFRLNGANPILTRFTWTKTLERAKKNVVFVTQITAAAKKEPSAQRLGDQFEFNWLTAISRTQQLLRSADRGNHREVNDHLYRASEEYDKLQGR